MLIPLQAFDYLHNGPIRTWLTFKQAVRHDMLHRVGRIQAPILILRGEKDPIAPERWVHLLASRSARIQLRTIEGAGHALNYNSAPEVARSVREFLASACGGVAGS